MFCKTIGNSESNRSITQYVIEQLKKGPQQDLGVINEIIVDNRCSRQNDRHDLNRVKNKPDHDQDNGENNDDR